MTIDLDYIRRKFAYFNDLCFEGKLQAPPFRLSRARTLLGQLRCRRKRTLTGAWRYFDFEFVVSRPWAQEAAEREVEDVILHEMIHYYIFSNQLQDSGPHGHIFKRMMQDLNTRFHRHIAISHKRTVEDDERDHEVRLHLVCVVRFQDGKSAIAVVARSRLFEIWDCMSTYLQWAEVSWYLSTDPFFNRYPRIRTPKLYPITRRELDLHLCGANKLVREGSTIRPC